MDATEVLYRALNVPGLVTPPNRSKAAGVRLRSKTTIGNEADVAQALPNGLEAVCESALLAVAAVVTTGELDPLIGGFALNERGRQRLVERLVDDATGSATRFTEWLPELVNAAIDAIVALAEEDPSLGWDSSTSPWPPPG